MHFPLGKLRRVGGEPTEGTADGAGMHVHPDASGYVRFWSKVDSSGWRYRLTVGVEAA